MQSIADVAPVLSASMTSMTAGSMVPARRALGILPGRRKFISAGLLAAAVLGALALLGIPVVREKIRAASTTAALPKSSQEWYADGQAYIARLDRKGNNVKAVEAFQKAIEGNPQNAAAYAGLQQLTNLAMEAARKAVELNPYLAAAHAALGASLIRAGRVDEAMRSIDQALALDPKSGMAHAYRAAAFEKKGDLHSAEGEYRQAVSLAPSVWSFRSSLAIVLSRLGRYPEAIDSFQGALQLTPDNGPVLANLGAAYHFAGKDEDAAAAFQRSLEVLPSARGFSNFGTLLFYLGRHADAAKAFEKAVSIDANPYVYWGNLGDAYRWTPGAREKSLEAYRQAIQLVRKQIQSSPKDAALRSSLATYLARSGKQEDALAEVAAIGGDGLKNPAVQFKIGLVYEIGHDRTRALDSLERALAAGYANKEVENEPELIELRRDARYHRLAAKYTKK